MSVCTVCVCVCVCAEPSCAASEKGEIGGADKAARRTASRTPPPFPKHSAGVGSSLKKKCVN